MSDLSKLASHLMRPREKRAESSDLNSFLTGRRPAERESVEQLAAATEFFHSMKHAFLTGAAGGAHGAVAKQRQADAAAGVKRNLLWGTTPVGQPSRLISGVAKPKPPKLANVLANSHDAYAAKQEAFLSDGYKKKRKYLDDAHEADNDHVHDDSTKHLQEQLKGIVSKSEDTLKLARIFGAGKPDGLDVGAIPYKSRKAKFENYLGHKSKEQPTPMGTAIGTGALAGGALGALAGVAGGPTGLVGGTVFGGIAGGAIGAALAAADEGEIRRAKRILAKGGVDDALANDILRQRRSQERSKEYKDDRRHRELIGAVKGRDRPSYSSPSLRVTIRPHSRGSRYKYAGSKEDETRAHLKELLARYRDKLEDTEKEAFITYGNDTVHLAPGDEDPTDPEQSGWKNYLGLTPGAATKVEAHNILQAAKLASGRNYLASAGAGAGLGALKSIAGDKDERKQDRLLSDLGAMPEEVAKKRRNRRALKAVGSAAAGGAAGAGVYGAAKHYLPKLQKEFINKPVDHAAKRFGKEGDKLVNKTKKSLDSSLDRAVDRLDTKTTKHVDRISSDVSEGKKNFNLRNLIFGEKKAPSAAAGAKPAKRGFLPKSKKKKWDEIANTPIGKKERKELFKSAMAPTDFIGAGGGALVGGVTAYRKARQLRDTLDKDSPDPGEMGAKDRFILAAKRDAMKHPAAATIGGALGGAVAGHAIQKGVTAPFRRF